MSEVFRISISKSEDIETVEAKSPQEIVPFDTVYDALKAAAAANPNKPAIKHIHTPFDTSPSVIDYASYLADVERAANLFYNHSQESPPVVAVIGPYLPEVLIAMWGGAVAGQYVPINPFLSLDHIVEILNAAKATILVTAYTVYGEEQRDNLQKLAKEVPGLKKIFLIGDAAGEQEHFTDALKNSRSGMLEFQAAEKGDQDCAFMHTGGTTGAPKLVRHTHRGQLLGAWYCGIAMGCEEDAVVGHAMPVFHVGGAIGNGLRSILFQQTLVSLTPDGFRNPDLVPQFWNVVENYGITCITTAPTTLSAILSSGDVGSSTLKHYTSGGAPLARKLAHSFRDKFGIWPREVWGGTEFHGILSFHYHEVEPRIGSCGRVVPFHQVKSAILEGNKFVREAKHGERGVIIAAGSTMMSGFVDSRKDTDFFIEGGPDNSQWATTGDVGVVDEDQFIWIYGREKDVIIRGGHNIDSAMIDDVLLSHPEILNAAAVGKPDAEKGELPIAYVQLRSGAHISPEEIIAFVRTKLSDRSAVPVEVILIDAIPLTGVGKVSKPPLRLDSIRRVVVEKCKAVAPACSVDINVREQGGKIIVMVNVHQGDYRDVNNIREELSTFTFDVVIEGY